MFFPLFPVSANGMTWYAMNWRKTRTHTYISHAAAAAAIHESSLNVKTENRSKRKWMYEFWTLGKLEQSIAWGAYFFSLVHFASWNVLFENLWSLNSFKGFVTTIITVWIKCATNELPISYCFHKVCQSIFSIFILILSAVFCMIYLLCHAVNSSKILELDCV